MRNVNLTTPPQGTAASSPLRESTLKRTLLPSALLAAGSVVLAGELVLLFQPQIELATNHNMPFIGCIVPSALQLEDTKLSLLQEKVVSAYDPRIPRAHDAATSQGPSVDYAMANDIQSWAKQTFAEQYNLTVFDTSKQLDELADLVVDKSPESVEAAYAIAADIMRKYGIELYVPDLPSATDTNGRTRHEGLSEKDQYDLKYTLFLTTFSYQDKPKELIDMTQVKVIRLESLEAQILGEARLAEKVIAIDPYKSDRTITIIDVNNHELGHFLDKAGCMTWRGLEGDPAFRELNNPGFEYDKEWANANNPAANLLDNEVQINQRIGQLRREVLSPTDHTTIALDLDNLRATISSVRPYGTKNRMEDIATTTEIMFKPEKYKTVNAIEGSVFHNKFVFEMGRLKMLSEESGNDVFSYYAALGGLVVDYSKPKEPAK